MNKQVVLITGALTGIGRAAALPRPESTVTIHERFVQHASLFLSEEDARASARR